jgi:RNA 3'-phosphate cyclase
MIHIDGSEGEGGGQMLRSALALSLLTGKPFRAFNIRANRPKPGLAAQHLASVHAAAAIGTADVRGDALGSRDLTFTPGEVRGGAFAFHIGTAGATGLVLQTVYLPLLLRARQPSRIAITGGTHVKAAPSFDFLATTWAAYLKQMGLAIKLSLRRVGLFPKGGGRIEAELTPAAEVMSLDLASQDDADVLPITGQSVVFGLPPSVGERMAARAESRLRQASLPATLQVRLGEANDRGCFLTLVDASGPAPTLFCGLGEKHRRAETVADEAVDELLAYRQAGGVDSHSADQLMLPLAFARGPSRYPVSRVTQHLLTNAEVIGRFVERGIRITGALGQPGLVEVE